MKKDDRYRMLSWWLCGEDRKWPRTNLKDKICRRADSMARGGVNAAIIFGAHFRWDYLLCWDRLHDLLAFTAERLHEREIKLFDHHSATLIRRPKDVAGYRKILRTNHYQLSLAPPPDLAANLSCGGYQINEWRMLDVITGHPVFLPNYMAEEFCMNHPGFREEYCKYINKLAAETGIDGLMCDDTIFYSGFRSCKCPYCRKKFGRNLPEAADLDFWGNWSNPEFCRWIRMRYDSVTEFQAAVRNTLPENIPLMNCCGSSWTAISNPTAMTYEEFAKNANIVMIEMGGDMPTLDGAITPLLPSLLHHLAVADEKHLPCIGLGYCFAPAAADFIWAFNKFLGSGTWLSTLKHRLRIPRKWTDSLPEEAELAAHVFPAEKQHPEYFSGRHLADTALFFSRNTRDNFGGFHADYAADYAASCKCLFDYGYDIDVVNRIPSIGAAFDVLVIPSAACLSSDERNGILQWCRSGKKIMATGPLGCCDENGNPDPWFHEIVLDYPARPHEFPENIWKEVPPARCKNPIRWTQLIENLFWHPLRAQDGIPAMPIVMETYVSPGWFHRRFITEEGKLLIHCLASRYQIEYDEEMEKRKRKKEDKLPENHIITGISRKTDNLSFSCRLPGGTRAKILFPFGNKIEDYHSNEHIELPADCWYLIIQADFN